MILIVDGTRTDWEQRAINQAALDAGWEIYKVFSGRELPPTKDVYKYRTYGSIEFTDNVRRHLGYKDVFLVEVPESFLVTLPEKWRKRDIDFFFKGESCDDVYLPKFIKPARGKEFEAKIYKYENVTDLPPILPCNTLVSEPVNFELEVRCFIRNQRCLTRSPYMLFGNPIEIKEPNDSYRGALSGVRLSDGTGAEISYAYGEFGYFLDRFLDEVDLPKTCVVDFGYIVDESKNPWKSSWAVVELNNVYSSGLYDCDPAAVLKCLQFSKIGDC